MIFILKSSYAQRSIKYHENWGTPGFTIEKQDAHSMQINYSVGEVTLSEVLINGEKMTEVGVPGIFLPNNNGAPNLPGTGRYIAIPQGAEVSMEILDFRTEVIHNINISPAPRIPKETEEGLEYHKDMDIYGKNGSYPAQTALISAPKLIRGVNVVMLGFTPFQYNPVTKDLVVYKDIRIRLNFEGGNGTYGDKRLRSRWFDPLLEDMLLNPQVLPQVDYNRSKVNTDDVGFEYLIICPDGAVFQQWADTIRRFRNMQGIITGVKTLTQVGGNTTTAIENYINNAYNTWTVPPVAVLLLGDYGTDITNTVVSPIWGSYCVSDNIYGDVNNDDLPDVTMARITAQNAAQLEVMIHKFINYEKNPPVDPNFYAHPVTCLGWQTERWFQICSEVVRGFWANSLGKTPVRVNEVYIGNPTVDPWSTATNTTTVVNYFGPSGLNYIPSTPQSLGGWTGGNASQINSALNSGAFMLQHRDHGYEQGWGEPSYSSSDISGLTNTKLSFIMSVNCLTGKYNYASEVFAEKFHRYTYNGVASGALGLLAASEISYSFVNDAFVWGVYDNMWPNFMPAYGSNPLSRGILPAFGNSAGKYFLAQSSWPYNSGDKSVTNNLFHHHGDAFLTVYSEVPQTLTVAHASVIYTGATTFSVTANAGSLICLSLNGEILGTATGTGSALNISIPGNQLPPNYIDIVITKQNYYRYHSQIQVIAPQGPYVVKDNVAISDVSGNNNSLIDFGEFIQLTIAMKNVGVVVASSVNVTFHTSDPYVTVTDSTENYGNIAANGTISVANAYSMNIAYNIPDNHIITFTITAVSGGNSWISTFTLTSHSAVLVYVAHTISDPSGNNNGKIDPGETASIAVSIQNSGSALVSSVTGTLSCNSPYVTINSGSQTFGTIIAGGSAQQWFNVTASSSTPLGSIATFTLNLSGLGGLTWTGTFIVVIGQVPVLIVNWDGNSNSAPAMEASMLANGVSSQISTTLPTNLSIFSSIFVCLGIYSGNHALSSSEGTTLASYLSSGGKMYMEGGDCWAYDAQTALQPMFNITGQGDGNGDLATLSGQSGTFTEGLSFAYSGDNNWIDHLGILSGSTAFNIFANSSPAYFTGIACEGSNYKTIGVSHEFGGLTDGSGINTKNELMRRYLEFFGLISLNLTVDFTASDTTILPGETVIFTSNCTGNPNSYSWSFAGGTPITSTLQNPVVTYNSPGNYTVSLTISKSTVSATITKNQYISVGFNSFSGQVRYDNLAQTPLSNVLLKLKSGTNTVMQTTSDNTGNYSFTGVPLGTYLLEASSTKPWGGVNSTDALLIMKHFVGMSYLAGLKLKAGDIDNSTYVNSLDALATQKRSIAMISSFPAGDWCFEKPQLVLSGSAQQVINVKGLCFADVNGSYIPSAMASPGILLENQGITGFSGNEEFTIYLLSKTAANLGALSVFLKYPSDNLSILDVTGPEGKGSLVFKTAEGILGISWISPEGVSIAAGEVAISLKVKAKSGIKEDLGFSCEMNGRAGAADLNGEPISAYTLSAPTLRNTGDGQLRIYPNPFSNRITIDFNLTKESEVHVSLFAVDGRKLCEKETIVYSAGYHSISINSQDLSGILRKGVYIVEVFIKGQGKYHQMVVKE